MDLDRLGACGIDNLEMIADQFYKFVQWFSFRFGPADQFYQLFPWYVFSKTRNLDLQEQ